MTNLLLRHLGWKFADATLCNLLAISWLVCAVAIGGGRWGLALVSGLLSLGLQYVANLVSWSFSDHLIGGYHAPSQNSEKAALYKSLIIKGDD